LKFQALRILLTFSTFLSLGFCSGAWAFAAQTSTSLTMSSGGSTVTSVAAGSVVTLTATVTVGVSPVTVGQVFFCDASAKSCTDIHLLGMAQLTSSGNATFKFIPGIGSHSYKAVFAGTPNGASKNAGSSSSNVALTVTGAHPTTTSIVSSGSAGNYSLTATVTGSGALVGPSGMVSFPDTTNANASLGAVSLGTATMGLNFLNSSNPPAGDEPWIVVAGDFNDDGISDLAVSNYADRTVSVYLGKGDGTFAPAPNSPFAAACSCQYMVVGDFNGDGKADLVLQGANHLAITVLLGNGDGTFTQINQVITTPSPYGQAALTVGDFNGDGIPDLAQTVWTNVSFLGGGQYSDYVVILLGNGDGTFTPSATVQLAVSATPVSISAGDFNKDGILDLAVVNYRGNNVSILLGNGDGTFLQAPNSPISVGSYPESVSIADLNGDGVLDLAVANSNYITAVTGTVSVLVGNGDGTFTQASNSPIGVGILPRFVTVGDFNGDGKGDLAVANTEGDTISILLGAGDGTFSQSPNSPISVGVYPETLAAADFNGDGISDLAAAIDGGTTNTVLLSAVTQTATASLTGISIMGTGTHQVGASYPGDGVYGSSISATTGLTAQLGTPTVKLALSSASITTAQALMVTISVSGGASSPTPTGSVTLTSGSYSATSPLNNGIVTISIPAGSLVVGTDTLSVSYTGDGNYATATGSAQVIVANAVPPSFSISDTAVTIASPGVTTGDSSTVTVTPAGGFTGSVALTASITSSLSGAVDLPTLSFGSTSPVTITGASAGIATLTITTAATSGVLSYPMRRRGSWYATGGVMVASLMLWGIPRRWRGWRLIFGVLFVSAIIGGFLGCSSGNSNGGGTTSNPGTTPGSYTVTVTGTSGSLTATSTVALTIQ
jgi:trimeric autotransporter adhesin